MGTSVPQEPPAFSNLCYSHHNSLSFPVAAGRLRGELALVIGDRTFECTPEQAQTKIWGYTIANDVTAQDLQQQDSQWTRAKGFDTFCPLGPWIVRKLNPGARLQTL